MGDAQTNRFEPYVAAAAVDGGGLTLFGLLAAPVLLWFDDAPNTSLLVGVVSVPLLVALAHLVDRDDLDRTPRAAVPDGAVAGLGGTLRNRLPELAVAAGALLVAGALAWWWRDEPPVPLAWIALGLGGHRLVEAWRTRRWQRQAGVQVVRPARAWRWPARDLVAVPALGAPKTPEAPLAQGLRGR